jgi:hypothetical protein
MIDESLLNSLSNKEKEIFKKGLKALIAQIIEAHSGSIELLENVKGFKIAWGKKSD